MQSSLYFSLLLFLFSLNLFASGNPIDPIHYTILSVSSDNESHPVEHAFDGDSTTWWAIYNSDGFSLPAYIEIELDQVYDLNGFSYLPNQSNNQHKALEFEIFLSEDGLSWGSPERNEEFFWMDGNDINGKDIFFGAVKARYILLAYNTSLNTNDGNIHTAELVFYESETGATGQQNQVISFEKIGKKYGSDETFSLQAMSNSGLEIDFEIISGPATVDGHMLHLTGQGGAVVVKAFQSGNAEYYPAEILQSFEVVDLTTFYPEASSRLSEYMPIEMDDLHAFPIYVNAHIEEPDKLSIEQVQISINGSTYEAETDGLQYYYWWTPADYGEYLIDIEIFASNTNTTTLSRTVNVMNSSSSQSIVAMEDVVIQFGGQHSRWFYGTATLPQYVGVYNQINASLTIECPNGDCDDWDRLAYIDVKAPDGNWIQIIRYITPYGVGCFHQIDLTDYSSILQGDVELKMFIDTWGTGGWQITLDLDYIRGTPEYLYSSIDELWDGTWNLGNPSNLQPVPDAIFDLSEPVASSHLRLSTTGHGWGNNNSQNAAEFYHATNFIEINGNAYYTQDLWNFCNPNPDGCLNQLGTWHYNRAGWCPGAISHPDIVDLTDIQGNIQQQMNYTFDPEYIDHCHPNSIDCISGVTCENCNAGYNPHYVVDAHIIKFSDEPIIHNAVAVKHVDQVLDYRVEILPNPTNGLFNCKSQINSGPIHVTIVDQSGKNYRRFSFENQTILDNYLFNIKDLDPGIYFLKVENKRGMGVAKIVMK